MAKYLFIQRGACGNDQEEGSAPSEEQMQQMYAAFNAWQEKYKDNILDMGGKLGRTGKVLTDEGVIDGPFVESKEMIGGFMIVTADSYEEALEVAKESPGMMMPGSSIEVREIETP